MRCIGWPTERHACVIQGAAEEGGEALINWMALMGVVVKVR